MSPGRTAPPPGTGRSAASGMKLPTSSEVVERVPVQRRAPFGRNPAVGGRGSRTQQRIIRAALQVFGEVGYDACRVERITAAAGCSRPSFYQYFSSKEDLFRQLAGQVASALSEVLDDIKPITPDAGGWHALRDWACAYAELYDLYWPVFATFAAAERSDEAVASGAARVRAGHIGLLADRIDAEAFRTDTLDVVAGILFNAMNRANRYRTLLERLDPGRAPHIDRFLDSLAEVLHRALFGRRGGGFSDHRPLTAPTVELPTSIGRRVVQDGVGPAGRRTRIRLVDAAAASFVTKGYHDARVDDIAAAAGSSHGTFYRYFDNKDDVFRIVAARSGRRVMGAIVALPDIAASPGTASSTRRLRRWADSYVTTWAEEGPIFRMWVEAVDQDPKVSELTVRSIDAVRSGLARFLSHRDFGDPDVDALLLVSLLDLTSDGTPHERSVDVLVTVIRRGFLGIDARY